MGHDEKIVTIFNYLKISDAKTIGEICYALGMWGNLHSSQVNSQKHLKTKVDLGQLEYIKHGNAGFYRVLGCKSEYGEHARLLTTHLAQILSVKAITATIHREAEIPIGLRADALVLCQREAKGICFVLEVAHHETHDYLKRKVDAWKKWKGAKDFLSEKFNRPIRSYGFVCSGKEVSGAVPFNQLLRRLK